MTTTITWSVTENGSGITEKDLGSGANGVTVSGVNVWITHDAGSALTGCKLYFKSTTSTYEGDGAGSDSDFDELLAWGDDMDVSDYGGIQVNFDGSWPSDTVLATKSVVDGTRVLSFTTRTGVGDHEDNAVTIPVEAITNGVTDGSIPVGESATFQLRTKIPDSEDTLGKRHFAIELVHD